MEQQHFFDALMTQEGCLDAAMVPPGVDKAGRFAIYRNNVFASLSDTLKANYPVCQQLVGEAFFRAMVYEYITTTLPDTPVLAHYGADFPDFIKAFTPAASVPYLADVASLEQLRLESYHASDVELPEPSVIIQQLGQEHAERYSVQFPPSMKLMRSPFAIVSLWHAHQAEDNMVLPPLDRPECALLFRHHQHVFIQTLAEDDHCFVHALWQGMTLGEAVHLCLQQFTQYDPTTALAQLLQCRLVLSLVEPESLS